MTPQSYIAEMNAKQEDLARMDPVLLAAINEMIAKIESQDAEIHVLKKRLASLTKKK